MGLEITRFIQGKRGGKNGYKIFDANTGETQEGEHEDDFCCSAVIRVRAFSD